MAAFKSTEDSLPRSMREIVQKSFLNDVLGGAAAASTSGWMILVMDARATRVISSALSMYDVMERRITLVEDLSRKRQPFKEMDALYIITATKESVEKVLDDFETEKKATYAGVHLYFLERVSQDIMQLLQRSPVLINHIKTLKEINKNFLTAENNSFHLDSPDALSKLYGPSPDSDFARQIASSIACLCMSLNEFPTIRYQTSSRFAYEIAFALNNILLEHKRADINHVYWHHGEDGHMERERGNIIILDRSFDPLSPFMHEYTYQAMVHDLLPVTENTITIDVVTNADVQQSQTVVLNESDELWLEFRHQHIARVIAAIKDRMSDIIQNNSGATLSRSNGADLSITDMAAAVKELPEYRETMRKLGQHVVICQRCMAAFGSQGLMEISQLEQTMSTGVDEDGKEAKGAVLVQKLRDMLRSGRVTKLQALRLVAIFLISQRAATKEEKMQVMQDARLTGAEQQVLRNLEKLVVSTASTQPAVPGQPKSSFFKLFKSKPATKHAPTAEGEYGDTRHVSEFRTLLDHLVEGDLPLDKYPLIDADADSGEQKATAKSARRAAPANKFGWGKKDNITYSSRRQIVFVAGGLSYGELRIAGDVMAQHSKEIIVGSTHFMSPDQFVRDIAQLDADSANALAAL